jgi:tape measure domain-containing protein
MGYNIGPTIAVRGEKDYTSALRSIKDNMKLVASEAAVMTAQFGKNNASVTALKAKNDVLNRAMTEQKKAVSEAEQALKRMDEAGVKPTDRAYVQMKTNLNHARAALESTNREIQENESALKSAGRQTESFGEGWKSFAAGTGKVAIGALKGIAVAAGAVAAATGAALAAALKTAFGFNKDMENYQTNFEVMLGSYELAVDKTQELKQLAASTPFEMSDLAQGTQTLLAFGVANSESTSLLKMTGDIALGNSDKFQRLNTALGKAESLGKLTGETYQQMVEAGFNPLKIISDQTGESMEKLQKRMSAGKVSVEELTGAMEFATSEGGQFYQGMEKASKTTDGLISTLTDNAKALVGSVLKPMTESIRTDLLPAAIEYVSRLQTAFDIKGFQGLTEEAGKIAQEIAQKINESIPKIVEFISANMPAMVAMITQTLTTIVSSATSALPALLPVLVAAATSLLSAVFAALQQNTQAISQAMVQIVTMLAMFLVQNLPILIETGLNIVIALTQGIAQSLPELIPAIVAMVLEIVSILTNPDTVIELNNAALQIILAVTEGLILALPELLTRLPGIVLNIAVGFIEAAPQLWQSGKELIAQMWEGIVARFSEVFLSIGQLVSDNITQPVKDKVSDFFNVGRDLIVGIWNGISDKIAWLKSQIKGLVNIIKGWFTGKDGFDEHSPSKWAFGVGYYITKALGMGTESGIGEALSAASNVINRVKSTMSGTRFDLDVNGNPAGSSGAGGATQYVFHIYARDKETAVEAADATLAAFQRGRWAVST